MKKLLIILLLLALLVGIGVLLFYHFVTRRVTDRGGMENPAFSEAAYHPDTRPGTAVHRAPEEEQHGTF